LQAGALPPEVASPEKISGEEAIEAFPLSGRAVL